MNTKICTLFAVKHPIVLGGMDVGTNAELAAAVSNTGGLGIQGGCGGLPPETIADMAAAIRRLTDRPFGLNLLLFRAGEPESDAVLAVRPAVLSTSWAKMDQELAPSSRGHTTRASRCCTWCRPCRRPTEQPTRVPTPSWLREQTEAVTWA